MNEKVKRHIQRAMSLSSAFGAENDLTVGRKAKIVSISISYTPYVKDANITKDKKANLLLLEGEGILYVEHLRKEVVRRGVRDQILEQFAQPLFGQPSLNHIEIQRNFGLTLEIKDGHDDLGEVVFHCTHDGEISSHDKDTIHCVLSDAFEAAAYAQGNHNIVSKFNGIIHHRNKLFRGRWGNHRALGKTNIPQHSRAERVKRHLKHNLTQSHPYMTSPHPKSRIISISISYAPLVRDANIIRRESPNKPLLLDGKEMHHALVVMRKGVRDEILDQFVQSSLQHIEIRDNFELTLTYQEKGHDAFLGEVVFHCMHDGEISSHDKDAIHRVLSGAFEGAAYVNSHHYIVSHFNGVRHTRTTLYNHKLTPSNRNFELIARLRNQHP